MTNHNDTPEPTRGDRLDQLLGAWHDQNKAAASERRDELLAAIDERMQSQPATTVVGRIGFGRMLAAAALLAFALVLGFLFVRDTERSAFATGGLVQVAEGGALDALDGDGNTLGPCPLQHTDVKVEISGLFARTVVEQTYANPYPRTIEAVYTFPLSHRAAVDRMTMIVRGPSGEKFVEGEVKERSLARAIYEEARESGYVASLLEQERPNIFTQSVANIEPGATVKVRIATIELAQRRNGVAEYVFPMVVGPRYIPGSPASMPTLPAGWMVRDGVVLRAPAGIEVAAETPFPAATISSLLDRAVPVRVATGSAEPIDQLLQLGEGVRFTAKYGNGSSERGVYYASRGLGEINGRFFHAPLGTDQGTGFAGDTNQVPDASRITPMPVKPTERAGHDISVSVTLDSGGPAISDVTSELHAVSVASKGASQRTIALDDQKTIPNRDFILRWKTSDAAIEPSFFTHVSDATDASVKGGYFALMLEPPARVAPTEVRPRELIFVLDVSGSMNGFPIEKSKALARKAIAAMRPNDTFNFITFAGATSVLWPEPRAANEENRKLAEDFVNGTYGSGGTEMMAAINAALVQEGRSGIFPAKLLDMPADGRTVRVAVAHDGLALDGTAWKLSAGEGRTIPVDLSIALPANPRRLSLIVDGTWETRGGDRVLVTRSAKFEDADARTRFVFFLTDGYVGNDQAIVEAVRDNARASRVFSFGIGNSVNRFLLEEMARAGRGTCEIVTLSEEADGVIERLVRRIESPVLTDIVLDIPASLGIREVLPAGDHLPDLYDQEPIVLLGRFDRAATGAITVRGRTGAGAWERTITVNLPAADAAHDVVKTLWARSKVDAVLASHLAEVEMQTLDASIKHQVVRLGESYSISTPYTSFVAVEKSRVVVGGKAMLVAVPVELPDGTNWAGFFGEGVRSFPGMAFDGRAKLGDATVWFAESFDRFGVDESDALAARASGDESRADAAKAETQATAVDSLNFVAGGGLPAVTATAAPTQDPAAATGQPVEAGKQLAEGAREFTRQLFEKKPAGAMTPAPSRRPGGAVAAAPLAAESPATRGESSESLGRSRRGQTGQVAGRRDVGLSGGFGGGGGGGSFGGSNGSLRGLAGGAGGVIDGLSKGKGAAHDSDGAGMPAEPAGAVDAADTGSAQPTRKMTTEQRDQLVRVLDQRLLLLALADLFAASTGDAGKVQALASELGVALKDGTVLVAMKVDAPSIDRLRALGIAIEAEDRARGLVVARVSIAHLSKLAATEGVRRIEPIPVG